MILEALTWTLTPCDRAARRLGYLHAAIGLQSRAARCREAWREHRARARQAVRVSLQQCSGRRTALVLGSGLLGEIPLD